MITSYCKYSLKNNFQLFLFLVCVSLPLYIQNILLARPCPIDDRNLIKSIPDSGIFTQKYLSAHLDLQPIRDVSLFLDKCIAKYFQIDSYILSNYVIFIAILIITFKIIDLITQSDKAAIATVLLLSVHPIFVNSICWISARKHLLASLYILILSYLVFLKIKKIPHRFSNVKIILLYLFSCLSHPIFGLWPIWIFFIYVKEKIDRTKNEYLFFASLFTISIFIILFNSFYYKNSNNAVVKSVFLNNEFSTYITHFILSTSRYFFNSLIPFFTNFYYSKSSYSNLIGISIGVLFSYVIVKFYRNSITLIIFSAALLSIFPVTIKMLTVFCSDTYSIVFTICIYGIFVNYILTKISNLKACIIIVTLLFVSNFLLAQKKSSQWLNFEDLIFKNVQTEWSQHALSQYILIAATNNKIKYLKPYIRNLIQSLNAGDLVPLNFFEILGQSIYTSNELSTDEKIAYFNEFNTIKNPGWHLFRGLVNFSNKNFINTSNDFEYVFKNIESNSIHFDLFFISFSVFCEKKIVINCPDSLFEHFKISDTNQIKSLINKKERFKNYAIYILGF